jgi:hypothetical protein
LPFWHPDDAEVDRPFIDVDVPDLDFDDIPDPELLLRPLTD